MAELLQCGVVSFNAKASGREGFEEIFMRRDFCGDGIVDLETCGTARGGFSQETFLSGVSADKFEALSVALWFVPGTVIFYRVAGLHDLYGRICK